MKRVTFFLLLVAAVAVALGPAIRSIAATPNSASLRYGMQHQMPRTASEALAHERAIVVHSDKPGEMSAQHDVQ